MSELNDLNDLNDHDDRRSSQRVRLSLRVSVPGSGHEYLARDLSADGVFLISAEPLAVGTDLNLELGLSDRPLKVSGVVVRTQVVPSFGAGGGLSGMAVHFDALSEAEHQRLEELVDSVSDALESARREHGG